jgi:hypothetical protein
VLIIVQNDAFLRPFAGWLSGRFFSVHVLSLQIVLQDGKQSLPQLWVEAGLGELVTDDAELVVFDAQ